MSADLLATSGRRKLLLGLLYVSEGAPIGYLWTALPTKLRAAGVPVEEVAALAAAITVPWTFKFLWAPLVDALRSTRYGVRPWIIGAQLAMGLTLLPLLGADLVSQLDLIALALVIHGFCAATQDVAIDALAVKHVPPAERGAATGFMQLGQVLGKALFGGVALAVEPVIGADAVVLALIAALWLSGSLALLARDHAGDEVASGLTPRLRRFRTALADALRRRTTWLGFAFAASAGAAMEATSVLAGPLLIDLGYSQQQAGQFFALPAVVGMALGVLLGGLLADRTSRARAAGAAVVLVAACVIGVAGLAGSGAQGLLVPALACAYLLFGVLTSASYAMLMDLTDPALGATQFSAYMGAINGCYVWAAWSAGQIAGSLGYPWALLAMALASLASLVLLPRLGSRLYQVEDSGASGAVGARESERGGGSA